MPIVKFIDVGRDKKCWEADIPMIGDKLDGWQMVKSIRKHGALMSREIDFYDGLVLVGMGRPVGKWEVVEAPRTEAQP